MAEELGEAIAESLTDMTCSDVKLKRSDKVISINAARERIKVVAGLLVSKHLIKR